MFHVEHPKIISKIVSRETFSNTDQLIEEYRSNLKIYLDQLLWWNSRINLVSRNVSRETIWQHIRHSLLLSQFDEFKNSDIVVDAGTGGGLPGLPLSITHPQKHFVLNDLATKKCLAVKQMAKKIDLQNIGIVDGSIEQLEYDTPFLLVSKHAFKINELYKMTSHLPWKKTILYKGEEFKNELKGIPEPLKVERFDLSAGSAFYNGKALVIISR